MMTQIKPLALAIACASLASTPAMAGKSSDYGPMMRTDTPATSNGWEIETAFTVGESVRGYTPPGILDGVGAFNSNKRKNKKRGEVRVLVNHELGGTVGYPYELNSGAVLTGARVSFFDIDTTNRKVKDAGLAYHTIVDRAGKVVINPDQIGGGLNRLCSARGIAEGELSFEDNTFMTGEETDGGTQYALDVDGKTLWAVPAMGRGAWESWTPVESGDDDTVALLGGDDRQGAPLYLYVGEKGSRRSSFLERNGLATGTLSCWVSDEGDPSSDTFNGFRATRTGYFVALENYRPDLADTPGYDEQGYATQDELDAQSTAAGCFEFSRPEDLHNNPANPSEAVFASTGRSAYPEDVWGTIYKVSMAFNGTPTATISILHDADALPIEDMGIRSPDNVTWASDGSIYVQEDRSIGDFGSVTGVEASIWKLSPLSGDFVRIAEMDRSAVAPAGSTDGGAGDLGNWESSGILDVTNLFRTDDDELLLIGVVQAHGIQDGAIGGATGLVEGGQIIFLSKEQDGADNREDDDD
jgi:secreted PhoX family phosphatase